MLKNFKYQNMQYMYVVQTSMNFLMLSVTKTLSSFNFGQYPPPTPPPPHTHTHTTQPNFPAKKTCSPNFRFIPTWLLKISNLPHFQNI